MVGQKRKLNPSLLMWFCVRRMWLPISLSCVPANEDKAKIVDMPSNGIDAVAFVKIFGLIGLQKHIAPLEISTLNIPTICMD